MKSDYEVLNIPEKASYSEIKSAYRNLAKKYHPDINKEPGAQKKFIEVTQAYENLVNDNKKYSFLNDHSDEDDIIHMRRQAREFVREQEKQRQEKLQQLLSRIYGIFNYVNLVFIFLNVVLIIDFFLPAKLVDDEIIGYKGIYEKIGSGSYIKENHLKDVLITRNYIFTVERNKVNKIGSENASIYLTPIFQTLKQIKTEKKNGGDLIMKPPYSFYKTFVYLIPALLLISIFYYLTSPLNENKLTLAIVNCFIIITQVIIYFSMG